ncbi:IucA/IucC family C-terminal-domain containing protein [Streptomyces geranii]|uniref:IucA/IucC family C-terminal-domain containing protein n=1 Tax=Streptomyces geranii TaxID=2058923 RepID=UPI000D022471|nr:IucA/IucC family C-terminal-domain containing protein [Streptomyces geranii]
MDLDPDLAALRPLGGFFVLRTAGAPTDLPPTLAQAYTDHDENVYADSITFRVRTVADRLRIAELRVSASIAQQALAARLWSIALGCAVRYGQVPDLDPRLLLWDAAASAPDDLWLTEVRPRPADAATVADIVVRRHLEPLTALLHARYGVAEGLLWGNAGSALAGAARELDRWARGADPGAGARARALAAELFTHPRLAPTGTLTGTAFRRRSCCLYYRVPGGGICGDCCFTRAPRSSPEGTSG